MMDDGLEIVGFSSIADRATLGPEIDAIFFAASATQSFQSEAARAAFRERWLGRYLAAFPDCVFLARDRSGSIIGYVAGSLGDAAQDSRFADISYFQDVAHLTRTYPAHLHINLAADARNRGIGGRLIEAFCNHAMDQDSTGVHVVTAETSRNRTFYARQGFELRATLGHPGRGIVFLGKRF